jgi:hypothetical protein
MIQENEIRVGNYFNRIFSINDKLGYIKWDSSDWYREGECIDSFEYYEPIPLTEDILLKCGFKLVKLKTSIKDFYVVYYKKDNFVVYIMSDFFEVELINNSGEQFNLFKTFKKELHTLQNLYFALTGEELQINFDN